ncbi:MAG: chorismate-binding protein [Myxococcales bacterium]|nr:chorismate-binding protein [Myxococcales bacterium]
MLRVDPSRESFLERAASSAVVPLFCELLADTLTPVEAFAKVGAGRGSYLLESVHGGEKWARYSFVGFEPELIVRGRGQRFERVHADGRVESETLDDSFEGLRATLEAYRAAPAVAESLGLPRFWGGAVGYVAYDAVRRFEPTVGVLEDADRDAADYDFCFGLGGPVLIFDNLRQVLRVVVPCRIEPGVAPEKAYERGRERLQDAVGRLAAPAPLSEMPPPRKGVLPPIPASSFDRESFCAAVEHCKEYIRAGDIFQVVLSQRFAVPLGDIDPFDVYRAMRVINPSPYMYFLRFADVRIAGASPETLVRLEDGIAEVRPIAGTRPRGQTAEEDAAIERELFEDPKEIAEHVMLVDLGRNDVGRISRPGSVAVTERMIAERYSHVMHITSNVVGTLAEGRDALDVLRATFPAGTLSGAPKVRAMQIIEELEPEHRGIYGGAVGYIGFDGNMDVAIAIRTVVEKAGVLQVQAGAGIVEASRPDAEYDETVNKARAALVSIEAARLATIPGSS